MTKILIVDDEYFFCRSLRDLMRSQGYDALLTTNGSHALDVVEEEQPDIMTLDIRMPGINGFEVLEGLRGKRSPLVIVISAIDEPELEKKIIQAGAYALLRKPLNTSQLLNLIKEIEEREKISEGGL